MNAMVRSSEASGYFKQANGATVFYSFPHDIETALIKGMNAIYAFAEIGQQSLNSVHDNNYKTVHATANENIRMQSDESRGNTEGEHAIN